MMSVIRLRGVCHQTTYIVLGVLYQRIGIQRSATLRKLRPRFFNSRHFASKCHIRHNSSYSASIAMATYCFSLAAILAVSVMHSSSRVITRDQQAKIADT